MKKIIKIWSICFSVFVLLITVFTVMDVVEVPHQTRFNQTNIHKHVQEMSKYPHSIIQNDAHEGVSQYIISQLEAFGLTNEDTVSHPAYQVQISQVTELKESANDLYQYVTGNRDGTGHFILNEPFDLKNVIVSLPSTSQRASHDVMLFMAHYDSVPMGPGASDDGVAVSVLLETIRYYLDQIKQGFETENDMIFVFSDGEEFGLYGADAYVKEFKGFHDSVSRMKLAVNLESRGTSGTLIMFETSNHNYNTIRLFSKVNRNVFTSSIANLVYQSMPNGTDFSTYKDLCQGLNLANLGGGENYHTQNDNYQNIKDSYLTQQAVFVDRMIQATAQFDLKTLNETNQDAIFFSYLNLGTIYYSATTATVFAVLAIGLIVSLIVMNLVRKHQTVVKTLKGYAVIAACLVASALVVFLLYYDIQLWAALFGNMDIHTIGKINYSNVTLIGGICIVALGISGLVCYMLMKVLHIEGKDVRRAMAYLTSFLGIVLTFVLPVTSYLFIFSGILLLINELLCVIFKEEKVAPWKGERIVFGLSVPLLFPVICLASSALGISMCYVYALLASILWLYFLPMAMPFLQKLTVASVKNVVQKTDIHMEKASVGSCLIAIIGVLILLVCTVSKPSLSMNLQGKQNIDCLAYDDALIYVIDKDQQYFMVKDLDAALHFKSFLKDYQFDDQRRIYYKEDKNPNNVVVSGATYVFQNNQLKIDRNATSGFVDVCIFNNQNMTGLTITYADGTEQSIIFDGRSLTFRIRTDAILTFETTAQASIDANIDCYELTIDNIDFKAYREFKNLKDIPDAKYNVIQSTTIQ